MTIAALDTRSPREAALLVSAVVLSLVGHIALAAGVSRIEPRPPEEPDAWLEMTMPPAETPPEPPKPPEPPPEPPKPEPKPEPKPQPKEIEPVDFKETTDKPPETPPPDKKPVRRLSQGLTNDSMATSGSGSFNARQGNTTSVAARPDDKPVTDEPFVPMAYESVTTRPKLKSPPLLVVPQEIIDAGIEGRVEAELTIGTAGEILDVTVVAGLHPAADAACIAALKKSRWTPGSRDGTPVVVRGVPYSCRYQALP